MAELTLIVITAGINPSGLGEPQRVTDSTCNLVDAQSALVLQQARI